MGLGRAGCGSRAGGKGWACWEEAPPGGVTPSILDKGKDFSTKGSDLSVNKCLKTVLQETLVKFPCKLRAIYTSV